MLGVVPTFRQVFDGLGSELPALTAFVLGVSEWMKNNWMIWVGGLFGSIFGLVTFRKTKAGIATFAPMPMRRLRFATRLIASSDDPFCGIARAQEFAAAWGSDVSILANAGHINTASGYGPWPDGLLTFGLFLRGLG